MSLAELMKEEWLSTSELCIMCWLAAVIKWNWFLATVGVIRSKQVCFLFLQLDINDESTQWRTAMNQVSDEFLCLSEHLVCGETEARQNLFLWGRNFFFFFFYSGIFGDGRLSGIPTQAENKLKQFLFVFLDFSPWFCQETHADTVVCLRKAACNMGNCMFSFCLP